MRFWTVHTDPAGRCRLVREGFSWGALVFGPLWFALAGAWVPAALLFAAETALWRLALRGPAWAGIGWSGIGWTALAVVGLSAAFSARDLVRWSLHLRGFLAVDVIAARDRASAWLRLFDRRPDLAASAARAA